MVVVVLTLVVVIGVEDIIVVVLVNVIGNGVVEEPVISVDFCWYFLLLHFAWFISLLLSYPIKLPVIDIVAVDRVFFPYVFACQPGCLLSMVMNCCSGC